MSSRKRARVGLFIAGGTYAYQTDMISGAHAECERRGLDLVCLAGGSLNWPDPRSYAYRVAAPKDLDAAILVPGTWAAPLEAAPVRELLEAYCALPACIIGARYGNVPSVHIDNEGGVAEITRHLLELHGRRRIAFIAGLGRESEERQEGYERALREAGIPPDPALLFPGDYTPEAGRLAAARWCEGGDLRCDAIIAANDWMALGALEVLQSHAIRVPEALSLVGFDDIDRARFTSPPLTTIRQPPRQLAIEAVSTIAALLDGTPHQHEIAVPTRPRLRRSCGCFGHVSAAQSSRPVELARPSKRGEARSSIARLLAGDAGPLAAGLPAAWAENLVDALSTDLELGTDHAFLQYLAELVALTAQQGNITAWHRVVSQLREQALAVLLPERDLAARAEVLFGRAYISIGERAEFAQARLLVEREDVLLRLEDASREARTALDWPALCRVLSEHLRGFRIPRFHVVTGDVGANGESRLVYAFPAEGELALPESGLAFPTSEVIPRQLRPAERTSVIVHALFMREEILGYCCLELGPTNGSILKTLGEVISSSLKATQLAEALVIEVTRRERAERARMLQELEIAARIQTAIVPRQPSIRGLELATLMRPASEVGGDYFDILPCTGGCWLGIGDVAGHGLPAGLVMLMIQSIAAATVHGREELQPREAWCTLNAVLSDNIRNRMRQQEHATLCLIRYEESGRLRFAGAHESLLLYRKSTGRVEALPTTGIWAGIIRDVPLDTIEEIECQLHPGDVLLLYTDGVVEAMSANREAYGIERLQSLLEATGELPVAAICERIVADVGAWMAAQHDDITLVVARHVGSN